MKIATLKNLVHRVLKDAEWVTNGKQPEGADICPICYSCDYNRHHKGCGLNRLLKLTAKPKRK